ncbi:MAG: hypothetical protein O7D94_08790 [Planctomycetota bacterium]|nr:hypothetical protein [Planctomycetota bacterium]
MTNTKPGVIKTWIPHLCAVAVAGAFLVAAAFKIWDPFQFKTDINNYHILPRTYANLFAIVLPGWEVAAALALILPATRRAGALLITGMLVMFIVAVSLAMYNGYDIDCGCFGKGSSAAGWRTIAQDVLLLFATAIAYFVPPRPSRRPAFPVVSVDTGQAAEEPA